MFLLCFKHERYVNESVSAALRQDYPNLKIVISDDASPDDSYKKIKALVSNKRHKHDVSLNRNEVNLGVGRHFVHVMESFVEGELAIACGGDDVSYPNRVSRMVQEWLDNGRPSLVAHSLEEIDEKGTVFVGGRTLQYRYQDELPLDSQSLCLQEYLKNQIPIRYVGAAIGYSTDTYFKFGRPELFPDYEDHLMYFRSLLDNGIHYFPEVLVKYRRHRESFTLSPVKPRVFIPPKIFADFLVNKNLTEETGLGDYRMHQLATQQWLDYFHAVRECFISVDYQLVDDIWASLLQRHKLLVHEKGLKGMFSSILRSAMTFRLSKRHITKKVGMNYVSPFKVILYGAGGACRNALSRLSPGFDVKAIADSNPDLHGDIIRGFTVIGPEEIKYISYDLVLVSSMYYYEIKEFLMKELGVHESKIVRLPAFVIA